MDKKYKYAILTVDSPECEDKIKEVESQLKGKALANFRTLIYEWGEGCTKLDGIFHISTDGQFWSWVCKSVGGPQPKSIFCGRYMGTIEELQKQLEKAEPVYSDDGKVCAFE